MPRKTLQFLGYVSVFIALAWVIFDSSVEDTFDLSRATAILLFAVGVYLSVKGRSTHQSVLFPVILSWWPIVMGLNTFETKVGFAVILVLMLAIFYFKEKSKELDSPPSQFAFIFGFICIFFGAYPLMSVPLTFDEPFFFAALWVILVPLLLEWNSEFIDWDLRVWK